MINITTDNYSLLTVDEYGKRDIIFDGDNAISNFSLIPIWKYNDCKIAIEYLIDYLDECVGKYNESTESVIESFIITCILTDIMKNSPVHKKIYSFCNQDSSVVYMLQQATKLFDPKSQYNNIISIDDFNTIYKESADIILINDSMAGIDIDIILKLAENIVKAGGIIICMLNENIGLFYDLQLSHVSSNYIRVDSARMIVYWISENKSMDYENLSLSDKYEDILLETNDKIVLRNKLYPKEWTVES